MHGDRRSGAHITPWYQAFAVTVCVPAFTFLMFQAGRCCAFGGPAIGRDGRSVAFSVQQRAQKLLYVMQADGTNARVVADSLDLRGAPAWAPDGQSITSAADDQGTPHLFRVPVDGRPPVLFVQEYSLDPTWVPDGRVIVYSGPDVGTTFSVKAVTAEGAAHPLPTLTLSMANCQIGLNAGFLRC